MLAIKGIYDGKKILPLEKTPLNQKFKVVITFLEELKDHESIRDFAYQSDALSFWDDTKEDLYQDYLNER